MLYLLRMIRFHRIHLAVVTFSLTLAKHFFQSMMNPSCQMQKWVKRMISSIGLLVQDKLNQLLLLTMKCREVVLMSHSLLLALTQIKVSMSRG